jgi:hypothetical protein
MSGVDTGCSHTFLGRKARSGQAAATFVILSVLLGLVAVSYWFADQYLRAVTTSVWDAVETINRAVQRVYGVPERSATITVFIPQHSTVSIKGSKDTLILEATGAFGNRGYRLFYDNSWQLIGEGSVTLTADGKLTVTWGGQGRPVGMAGGPIVLGTGRYTIVVKNIGGTLLEFHVVERGVPTEVLKR